MDKRLHLLESFNARGSDGQTYVVHGYEHLARVATFPSAPEQWEATGVAEYKLADGRRVEVGRDDVMRLPESDVVLERQAA